MRPVLCSAMAISMLLAAAATLAADTPPATRFLYDEVPWSQSIKPAWSSELIRRLPEISALWASVSPALVAAVTAATKKPFSAPKTVHLTLTDRPSNSFLGVTVNMRYALRSFTATPVPMRYKIDTVFHEALHGFISMNTPRGSPLLARHTAESTCVRNHLHLLSLQKDVLLRTNDIAALEQVVVIDSQLPSGCYKRAWAIVNATPGTYRQYVAELSQ